MSDLLKGKLCVVLGIANKWSIAYAIAQAFSREGADLVLSYLSEHQKGSLERIIEDLSVVKTLPCDVTKDEDLAAMTETLRAMDRPVHAVVHSLAFANREDLSNPFVETSREGFLLAQNVSAYSLVAIARATASLMTEGGAITCLTYVGSSKVVPNYNVMGTAKAALESSTRYLAHDLGPRGIRVNAISAGPIKTASARAVKDLASALDTVAKNAPLRKNTDPAEVADAAVFLSSDLGRGVTGTILFVDAGISIMGL